MGVGLLLPTYIQRQDDSESASQRHEQYHQQLRHLTEGIDMERWERRYSDGGGVYDQEGEQRGDVESNEDRESPESVEDNFLDYLGAMSNSTEPNLPHGGRDPLVVDPDSFSRHHQLPPILRQIYTKALYNRVKGASFAVTDQQLKQDLDLANLVGGEDLALSCPKVYTERTRTALRFIGANPDDILDLDVYITCPICWKLTSLRTLYELECPVCGKASFSGVPCGGVLFSTRLKMRTPVKVIAYHPLSIALSTLLQDPEVVSNLQTWRGDSQDDAINNFSEAMAEDRGAPYVDQDLVMRGFWHGVADQ